MLFICYPICTTCRKAKNWLDQNSINYTERNIKTDNPSFDELRTWITLSGLPIKKFFNTSGNVYKELDLKNKLPDMSDDEKISLLASNGMLVKRPLLINEKFVLVGFNEDQWGKIIQK